MLAYHYDILCFTETQVDNTYTDNEVFQPSNKTIYRKDRNFHEGEVMSAIEPSLYPAPVNISFDIWSIEAVAIHVVLSRKDLVVVCLYILSNDVKDSLSSFNDLVGRINNNSSLLILGDFNFPDMNWTKGVINSGSNQKELHKYFLNLHMNCIS